MTDAGAFGTGTVSTNPTQLAVLAVEVHEQFLDPDVTPSPRDVIAALTPDRG